MLTNGIRMWTLTGKLKRMESQSGESVTELSPCTPCKKQGSPVLQSKPVFFVGVEVGLPWPAST